MVPRSPSHGRRTRQSLARGCRRAGGRTPRPGRARVGRSVRPGRRAAHHGSFKGLPRGCLHGVHARAHERTQPPADRPVQPAATPGQRLGAVAAHRQRTPATPGFCVRGIPARAGGNPARLRPAPQKQRSRRTRRRRNQYRHARGIRAPTPRARTRHGGPFRQGWPGASRGGRWRHEHLARRRAFRGRTNVALVAGARRADGGIRNFIAAAFSWCQPERQRCCRRDEVADTSVRPPCRNRPGRQ